jgi:hypothetical protein
MRHSKKLLACVRRIELLRAAGEHRARRAWFDAEMGAVMVALADGRVFGLPAESIPPLRGASEEELSSLRASEDGAFLVFEALGARFTTDAFVTRLMMQSPLTINRAAARQAGQTVSAAKAEAARRNARRRVVRAAVRA